MVLLELMELMVPQVHLVHREVVEREHQVLVEQVDLQEAVEQLVLQDNLEIDINLHLYQHYL
jgi:hypothetical protein